MKKKLTHKQMRKRTVLNSKILVWLVIPVILFIAIIVIIPGDAETTVTDENAVEKPSITVKETDGKLFWDEGVRYRNFEVSSLDTNELLKYCAEHTIEAYVADWFLFYKKDSKTIWLHGPDNQNQMQYAISKNCPDLIIVLNYGEGAMVMDCEWFK